MAVDCQTLPSVPTSGTPARRAPRPALGGSPATPLLVLFGLNLVDELDRLAFAALTPEIRDAFGLGDDAIVAIGAVSGIFILVGALPIGYLGDRASRLRIAAVAAIVWGAMSVLTGLAWAVWVLFAARLLSGIARTSNEVVHPSLLVDWYPHAVQPRVFQLHRLATPLSASFALVVGGLGTLVGWRLTFVLSAAPTFVLLLLLLRLQEPIRGAGLPTYVASAAQPRPLSFGAARRVLFGVGTLRRCWAAGFLLGTGFVAIMQLLSLFFEQVHGFGPWGRGVVQFAYGLGTVVGIMAGARVAMRATLTGRWVNLVHIIGAGFLVSAVALLALALTPWAPVAVGFTVLLGVGLGVWQPAYYPLVARIVPPRVRTQAYGWTLLFSGLGALLAVPLARYAQQESYRTAFAVLAAVVVVGAAVAASASGRVDDDVARADAAA